MTPILCVLGASGFLGVHVVRAARAAGFRVAAAARRPSPIVDATTFDATDAGALDRWLDEHAPDAIVNCAALSRVADSAADPALARRLNADLPARIARRVDVRVVHVSTDLVHGGRAAPARGFDEDAEPAPTSEYGRTKLAGERALLAAHPRALVARLPLLCGDSFGRGLGASDSVFAAVARGQRPRLYTDEVRTPLDVEVAARALVELARLEIVGVLNVAGPERATRHELGLRALRAAGRERAESLVEASTRSGPHADRPADVALDASRARSLLDTPLPAPFAREAWRD